MSSKTEQLRGLSTRRIKRAIRKRLKTPPKAEFQVKGVRFAEKHRGRILIADKMGLGKTWQTIAWCAIHPEKRPVIVVCPATLKYKWQREWLQHAGLKSYIVDGEMTTRDQDRIALRKRVEEWRKEGTHGYKLRQMVHEAKKRLRAKWASNKKKVRELLSSKIVIVNYDIVEGWLPILEKLAQRGEAILILDECHYLRNRSAKRTKGCRSLSRECDHVIGLSGTPIEGKPSEFFPILNMIRPDKYDSFWTYAFKYCAPKKGWGGSWDFSGAANLDALHSSLKSVMIRREKKGKHGVLKDLPDKLPPEVIPVEITNRDEYEEAEQDFLSWLLRKKGQKAWTSARRAEALVKLGQLKHLAAMGKLKDAFRWVDDWLEGTDEKLIIFGVGTEILDAFKEKYPKAALINGSISNKPVWVEDKRGRRIQTSKRQQQVDKFQTDPKTRLILIQLRAGGEGIDLVAASSVFFAELGWTPGAHEQGEDRAHRIGQTKQVSVYYMVGRDTIEERVLDLIQAKDDANARILDGRSGGVMKLLDIFMRKAKKLRRAS